MSQKDQSTVNLINNIYQSTYRLGLLRNQYKKTVGTFGNKAIELRGIQESNKLKGLRHEYKKQLAESGSKDSQAIIEELF